MVLSVLDEFFWVLRREGFTVSTAQALDAVRAAELVGFEERLVLRDALAAVVVKRAADVSRFQVSFDAFFAGEGAHGGDLFGRLRARGFSDAELGAVRELLDAAAERSGASGDAVGLRALAGTDSELDHLLRAAGVARALAPTARALQAGFFTQRTLEALGVSGAASALKRMRDALREGLGEERGSALAAALGEELERLRRRVRSHVEATIARRLDADAPSGARSRMDTPFAALPPADLEAVRRAVRGLAERLRGAERMRRRRARRGRIDPHRTLRASMRTAGVPFVPARKKRRRDRPRLIILCDVSDSVRLVSGFLLELACAAQELFARTRTFVFVSEIAETTGLFSASTPGAALARIASGSVVRLGDGSNYGRALRSFEERFGRDVDRRTTVVILGDGRTNYMEDGAECAARLRDRARALVWLCPEAPEAWGTADSAMLRYVAVSTRVLVARTARELEAAARTLVALR